MSRVAVFFGRFFQERSQWKTMNAKPQSQRMRKMAERSIDGIATVAACSVKGWLIWSITNAICGGATVWASRHGTRAPMLTSAEKGIRNFREAASQIQYLTAARFLCSVNVSSHARPAKTDRKSVV